MMMLLLDLLKNKFSVNRNSGMQRQFNCNSIEYILNIFVKC